MIREVLLGAGVSSVCSAYSKVGIESTLILDDYVFGSRWVFRVTRISLQFLQSTHTCAMAI